jgi:acetyl-CoA synthetase
MDEARIAAFLSRLPPQLNFADVVDAFAEDRGRVAVYGESASGVSERLTFWDVRRRSSRVAAGLRRSGIQRGDRVAIVLPARPEWAVAVLAVLRMGAVAVLESPTLAGAELIHRLVSSDAVAAIADDRAAAAIDASRPASLRLHVVDGPPRAGWHPLADVETATGEPPAAERMRADEPAVGVFGSAGGRAEAFFHSHTWACAQQMLAEVWLDLSPQDLLHSAFDVGSWEGVVCALFAPWSVGAPTLLYDAPAAASDRLALLENSPVTVLAAPPLEYRRLLDDGAERRRLPGLRHCVSTAERLPAATARQWQDRVGTVVHEAYGRARTGILAANARGLPVRPGSVGRSLPGHHLDLLDGTGDEVPSGALGEMVLRAGSAAVSPTEAVRVGDLARRDGQGYLWLAGPTRESVPDGPTAFEIERTILDLDSVRDAAVVAVGGIVALVATAVDTVRVEREVRHAVAAAHSLDAEQISVRFVDEIPRGPKGIIARHVLAAAATLTGCGTAPTVPETK